MFLENASRKGWIEVICGSMFSGKTEELIRRLKRAQFAHQKVEIYKPRIDVRYSEEEVVSHDANAIRSTPVDTAQNILRHGRPGGTGQFEPGADRTTGGKASDTRQSIAD